MLIITKHLVFIFLLTLVQVHSTPEQESLRAKGVTILTDNDFESRTGIDYRNPNKPLPGDSDYVVLFFASFCGHCKHFIKQIYIDIMEMTAVLDFKIIPAALQCPENPKTAHNFEVRGYPQIHYFQKSGGHFQYPRAERSKLSILKFIKDSHEGKQYIIGSESQLLKPKPSEPKPEVKVAVPGDLQAKGQQNAKTQSEIGPTGAQKFGQRINSLRVQTEKNLASSVKSTELPISQKQENIFQLSDQFKIILSVVISLVFVIAMIGIYKVSSSNHQDHTRLIHVQDRSNNNEEMYVIDPNKKDTETLEQDADENEKVEILES